jgi:release factor glutamine methyltransferase
MPNAQAVAVDVSPDACAAARETLSQLGLDQRAAVLELDWRNSPIPGAFDLIVSNPPYIPTRAIAALDPEVREHDPIIALDGGEDGLDAYRTICSLLPRLAALGAIVALETGEDQGQAVRTMLERAGGRSVAITCDYAGRERVVCGQMD